MLSTHLSQTFLLLYNVRISARNQNVVYIHINIKYKKLPLQRQVESVDNNSIYFSQMFEHLTDCLHLISH